jgi:thioredoxin reductase (NADPH)
MSTDVPFADTQPGDVPAGRARRPAIIAVDDEPTVLAAVSRDLRRGFGERYRILRAPSGPEALEVLAEVRRRGDQVALLIADQRMPGMAGTEFLVQARALVPDAKRVLLTAYADTDAAISAINDVALDYYLTQAVGPAAGAALPGPRGPPDDVGGRRGARGRRAAHHRPPVLEGVTRPA